MATTSFDHSMPTSLRASRFPRDLTEDSTALMAHGNLGHLHSGHQEEQRGTSGVALSLWVGSAQVSAEMLRRNLHCPGSGAAKPSSVPINSHTEKAHSVLLQSPPSAAVNTSRKNCSSIGCCNLLGGESGNNPCSGHKDLFLQLGNTARQLQAKPKRYRQSSSAAYQITNKCVSCLLYLHRPSGK